MGAVGQADEADGQVAQGGHDLGSVAGAQLVTVLIEDHVPDPVETVLDPPVPADPGRDGLGLGVGHGQGAHQVDHLDALAAFDGSGAADLDRLSRPREVHPLRDIEGLDGAPHPPTVRGVDRGDGRDVPPGQGLERPAQGLLVVLDRQEVVTTTPTDPLGGVRLGVHGVSGHHDPAWVEGFKQDPESRDLVGFVRDSSLGQDSAGDLVQGRQQMRGRRVAGAGAAHGLAIHGDHCAAVDGAGARAQPGRQVGVEVCGVQVLQDPSDGGLRWKVLPLLQPQRAQVGAGQVGGVLPYRRQAPAAGQHLGDGQGQDRGQVMAHAPKVPGISHVPENLDQGLARQGSRGGG